jgi:hypothetical protein
MADEDKKPEEAKGGDETVVTEGAKELDEAVKDGAKPSAKDDPNAPAGSASEQLQGGGDGGLEKHVSPVDAIAEEASKPGDPLKPPPPNLTFVKRVIGRVNIYLLIFIVMLVIAVGVVAVMFVLNKKEQDVTVSTQKLTQDTVNQLKGSTATVGDPKSVLSVESNTVFAGQVVVKGAVDIAGALKIGGTLTMPGITVTGAANFDQISANGIKIANDGTFGGKVDIQKTLTTGGDISAGGNLSVKGAISAASINIDNISITHINISGPTPSISVGGSAGGGGTASIVGTDTAGTANINTGGGPSAGILATIKFTKAYSSPNPHVVLTPNGPGCAEIGYYVTNITANGFAIGSSNTPPSGATCKFNYIVVN